MRPQRLARSMPDPGREQVVVLAVRGKQGVNQDGLGRTKADSSVRRATCVADATSRPACADTDEVLVRIQYCPPVVYLCQRPVNRLCVAAESCSFGDLGAKDSLGPSRVALIVQTPSGEDGPQLAPVDVVALGSPGR